jgi:hypothetical protein
MPVLNRQLIVDNLSMINNSLELTLRGAREKTHRGARGAGGAFFH